MSAATEAPAFKCRAGRRATRALLPAIDAALAQLRAQLAALDALPDAAAGAEGDGGERALETLRALAANPLGSEPLGADCAALLAVWDAPPVPAELEQLLARLEAAVAREKAEKAEKSAKGGGRAEHPSLQRVRAVTAGARRKRPRSRPRRRFEDADGQGSGSGSGSQSDAGSSCSRDGSASPGSMAGEAAKEEKEEEGKAASKAEPGSQTEQRDASQEDAATQAGDDETTADAPEVEQPKKLQVDTVAAAAAPERAGVETAGANSPATLGQLRALRKTMMLDVLSKVVSVAKSKGVVSTSLLQSWALTR